LGVRTVNKGSKWGHSQTINRGNNMKILKELQEKDIKIGLVDNDRLWIGPKERLTAEI